MHSVLNKNTFFVKEKVGMFKAANEYDIFDPEADKEMKTPIIECREPNLGFFTKMFRFGDYKTMTPFHVELKTPEGEKILTVKRGVSFFLSKVEVLDENDQLVGMFKQKLFSIGGAFDVLDTNENVLCKLKGKWTSWDFRFEKDGVEFASVSKEWAGFAKEFFTTADNYVLKINDTVAEGNSMRTLIMAAIICIDMVLKE